MADPRRRPPRRDDDDDLHDSPEDGDREEGGEGGEPSDEVGVAYFGDGGLNLNGGGSIMEILSGLSSHEDDEEEVEDAFNTLAGRCVRCACCSTIHACTSASSRQV